MSVLWQGPRLPDDVRDVDLVDGDTLVYDAALRRWVPTQPSQSVATSSRPSLGASDAGASVFDTTLGKPIWWNGTAWVDATGTPA